MVSVNYPLTESSSLIDDKLKTDVLLNDLHEARRSMYEALRSRDESDIQNRLGEAKTTLKKLTDHLKLIREKARNIKLMESML